MKKVASLFLAIILIGALVLTVSCTKNSSKESNKTEIIETEFTVGNEKVELHKVSILSNKVDILLPKSFSIMSEEMAKTKYPSERRPTIIYTNVSASVNIALNYTQNKATNSKISTYLASFRKSFENMYPSAKWYNSNVENVNGKNVGVLELLTPASDTEIYNLMWFTDLDGRLLISTFNCTKEQMNDWKQVSKSIMRSQTLRK